MLDIRDYGLDFMKFIAVLMITNSHYIPLYEDVNIGFATFGAHGVALFFFVSGYLLMMGFEKGKENFVNWYKRRIRRLWPAVFLWVMFAAIAWNSEFTWQKILLASDYWFLQTIFVYYFLFYLVGHIFQKSGELVCCLLFIVAVSIAIVSGLFLPNNHLSLFHDDWHYICHFPIMLMGGLVYKYREKVQFKRKWLDWILLAVSFVAFFVIQKFFKNANDWHWYLQLFAYLPLISFCYYAYKVCAQEWCNKLMTNKIWKWPFSVVTVLTLEIYVVQFDIITDKFNWMFPLNTVVVFVLICIIAYCLHVFVNLFLQVMSKADLNWKECVKI